MRKIPKKTPSPGRHRAGPQPLVERFLATRSRKEVLSIDWSTTNRALGSLLGLSPSRVSRLRLALRKKGYPVPKAHRGAQHGSYRSRDNYLKTGIGKVPDRVVAETLGVTRQAVYAMRRVLGIPVPSRTRIARRRKA